MSKYKDKLKGLLGENNKFKRKKLWLNEQNCFITLKKGEADKIRKTLNKRKPKEDIELDDDLVINVSEIRSFGYTKYSKSLDDIFDYREYTYKCGDDDPEVVKSFICYRDREQHLSRNSTFYCGALHEDAHSSWLCAMEILHYPEYGVIIEKNK